MQDRHLDCSKHTQHLDRSEFLESLKQPACICPILVKAQQHLLISKGVTTPTLFGKGAKQWRDGDWMCTNCKNHNYASRSQCNRCKTERETVSQPVSCIA